MAVDTSTAVELVLRHHRHGCGGTWTRFTRSVRPYEQARLERRLFARFWQTASPFWLGRWAKVAWGLTVFLMLVVLAQVAGAAAPELVEPEFLRCGRSAATRRLCGAGAAVRALGAGEHRACRHLGLGAHDGATQMARMRDAPGDRILAGRGSVPPARPARQRLGESRIPHLRGRSHRHRRTDRPRARLPGLGADGDHLLERAVERRREPDLRRVWPRLDHPRLSRDRRHRLFHRVLRAP